jgi:hypothetical protein
VRCKCRVQVYVGNDLSVDNDKGVTVEQCAGVVDRTAGPEDFRFFDILQFYSEPAAIAESLSHRVWPVMEVDCNFVAAVACQIFSYIADEWFA